VSDEKGRQVFQVLTADGFKLVSREEFEALAKDAMPAPITGPRHRPTAMESALADAMAEIDRLTAQVAKLEQDLLNADKDHAKTRERGWDLLTAIRDHLDCESCGGPCGACHENLRPFTDPK
jgi:BMFP domain-containing protein YqiC